MAKASKHIALAGAMLLTLSGALFSACDDITDVGSSLVNGESVSSVVVATDFTIKGTSVVNTRVQTRTSTQVLGRIAADGYGSFNSDFVTQFLPAATLPTEGVTIDHVDSLKILFYVPTGSLIGDSIAPMGLEVYRLNRQLPLPIFSNFDPKDYYSPTDGLLGSRVYVANSMGVPDSLKTSGYTVIDVMVQDRNLVKELYNLYLTNPTAYQFPQKFAQHFPGIYVKNSYGSGRVVGISNTLMRMYYRADGTDSKGNPVLVNKEGDFYAVAPEIVLNNNIDYTIDPALQARIAAGEEIIVAPVGRDLEMTFPINEVLRYYETNKATRAADVQGAMAVVNTLSFEVPAEAIENAYEIAPPKYLLMVLSKDKEAFFSKNQLTNNKTSFYAEYDSTNKRYYFGGLRNYFLEMLAQGADKVKPEDYTFTLTPANVVTETNTSNSYYGSSQTVTSAITPYIGTPVMVKLDLSKAKIQFTFSKQVNK